MNNEETFMFIMIIVLLSYLFKLLKQLHALDMMGCFVGYAINLRIARDEGLIDKRTMGKYLDNWNYSKVLKYMFWVNREDYFKDKKLYFESLEIIIKTHKALEKDQDQNKDTCP